MRLEHWFYKLPLRLRSLFRRKQTEQDLEDELQFHLAQKIEHEIAGGKTPADARYTALRAMQGIEQRKEEIRDLRQVRWLQDLAQDVGYSLRTLGKAPGFTAVSAIVLALGIGANTAVFTIVNGVLLRPLPYTESDRLFLISTVPKALFFDPGPTMVDRDYLDFRRHNHSFESLASLGSAGGKKVTLTRRGNPTVLTASQVGPDFLRVLRVSPAIGRGFLAEGKIDPNIDPNAVLVSHSLWKSRFNGDPKAIGTALTLDGVSYSIVGVMPDWFTFQNADLWIRDEIRLNPHNAYFLPILGRLKPGVSPQRARVELFTFAAALPQDHGLADKGYATGVLPLKELFVAGTRKLLLIFSGAVALVFLIACANFANLLLIRGAGRGPEMAVRAALGASRGRLIRQSLAESTVLSLAGAVLGLLLSVSSVHALSALLPLENIPARDQIHLDMRVLAFTFGLSLVTGLIFGLAPALRATHRELREGISEGGRNLSIRSDRIRAALVTTEIALAVVLLAGAGLLLRSFLRLHAVNPGFRSTNLVVATFDLPRARYQTTAQMRAFDERMLSLVSALRGTKSAAAVSFLPFGFGVRGDFQLEDGRHLPADYNVDKPAISSEYFHSMGINLISGRAFTDRDTFSAPGVVILSESISRHFWPAGDAVGKRISMEDHPKPQDWLTIVGVVGDVRQQGLTDKQAAVMYQPYQQMQQPGFLEHISFVARCDNPRATAGSIPAIVRQVDRDLPTQSVTTMDAIVADSMTGARSQARLLGMFSLSALALAAIGIYGVLACSITERTHEIGVRMALGAQQTDILWQVISRTLAFAGTGCLIGALAALAVTRVLSKFLFEVTPTDPLTFLVVIAILLAVALLSAWAPARNATRVHPLVALRHQ